MAGQVNPGYGFRSREQVTSEKLRALWQSVPGLGSGAVFSNFDQTNMAAGAGLITIGTIAPTDTESPWFDTALNLLRLYNGTDWIPVGRGIVLTNKSGSAVVRGDVVIVSTTNDEAFNSTTTLNDSRVLGVAAHSIANNAKGVILTEGPAVVNLDALPPGSTPAGILVGASATPFKATASATPAAGQFGFLSTLPVQSLQVRVYLAGQPLL